jgi:3-oxoacyl-[acyl-carrier-protein] synthase II
MSIRYGAKGPISATSTACATSANAIGDSVRMILHGDADVMIAGGAEASITQLAVGGFAAMRALSTRNDEPTRASRPFDKDRDGFVIGEGSGILILEELEFAKARGAKILAEIIGYGMSADAYHITAVAAGGAGAQRSMRAALSDAGIQPEQVGYINAHATSTSADSNESQAIEAVFGEHALGRKLKISGTKSMHGHLLGGAGALEAGISVLALQNQMLPPTINLENIDPECRLDYVPNKAVAHSFDVALSNSFGFGGINATLVMRRWTE